MTSELNSPKVPVHFLPICDRFSTMLVQRVFSLCECTYKNEMFVKRFEKSVFSMLDWAGRYDNIPACYLIWTATCMTCYYWHIALLTKFKNIRFAHNIIHGQFVCMTEKIKKKKMLPHVIAQWHTECCLWLLLWLRAKSCDFPLQCHGAAFLFTRPHAEECIW